MDFSELKKMILANDAIAYFGGAGTSTESNIPDFRSKSGLSGKSGGVGVDPEEILRHTFFLEHTRDFFLFFKRFMLYPNAMPNAAHLALAELERRKQLLGVITQNIDGLHQMAGNKNVIELHGSVHKNYCIACGKFFNLHYVIHSEDVVPRCDCCNGIVRPGIVLYEEALNDETIDQAKYIMAHADVLIVGGTSLTVHPAASLIHHFKGKAFVLINHTPTPFDGLADYIIPDDVGKVLKVLVT